MSLSKIFKYCRRVYQRAKNTTPETSRIEPRDLMDEPLLASAEPTKVDAEPTQAPAEPTKVAAEPTQAAEQQEAQIKWIRENVKFYPVWKTTVYHEGSAYDILLACQKYKLDFHTAPRLFTVAVKWRISYQDAAEMIHAVDSVQG